MVGLLGPHKHTSKIEKPFRLKKLQAHIQELQQNPNAKVFLGGDLFYFPGGSEKYREQYSPTYMDQVNIIRQLLEPIKDKILVIGTGNHEDRISKETNIDVIRLVAKQLGIEDRYASNWWYLFLRFGEKEQGRKAPMCYQITGYHGSGGGRKVGGKANRLEEMSQTVIADLYIMGHTHKPLSTKSAIYLPDYANNTLNKKQLYYLMTNSFLDYGGYGEKLGFTPTDNTPTEAVLDGTKRRIKVIL
jgi:hypothetical protein